MVQTGEKRQTIEIVQTELSRLISAILNVFRELKETMFKEQKEGVRTMSPQIENYQ